MLGHVRTSSEFKARRRPPPADLLGTAFLSDHFAALQPQGSWGSSRLQQALKAYQRALACGADLADLHWNCAMVQLYLQDYQAALQVGNCCWRMQCL